MASSAALRSEVATAMLGIFGVWWLMTNLKLLDCTTGKFSSNREMHLTTNSHSVVHHKKIRPLMSAQV